MDVVEWIRMGLEKPGKTQTGLAAALGRAPSAVTALLKGDRHVKVGEMSVIANYLEEPPPTTERTYTAPVMGLVGAGAQIDVGDEQVPDGGFYDIDTIIPLPPGAIAFEVTGDSMEPRYAAGDIVVVLARGQPVEEIPNGVEAAVLLEDGLRYLKKIWRDPNGTYTLQSHNAPPIYGARLTWVSDVLVIIPARKWKKLIYDARRSR